MAPELLLQRDVDESTGRQSRKVDIFSLGCLIHYIITGGRHPYGDNFERD